MARLAGKIAFITGVARGQGRTAALLFAREGARIVGCDLDAAGAQATAAEVASRGGVMTSHGPMDLSRRADAREWIDAGVAEAGGIDILYNNAGALKFAALPEMSEQEWDFTLRNELDLVFNATQAAWPHLISRGGGSIVNTASGAALRGNGRLGASAHAAAKAAVMGLTRQAAAEGAPHKIRVNSVSPGAIEPPAGATYLDAATSMSIVAGIPLGVWGQPEDVAHCALYLASDEARWVTGAVFVVDGGVNAVR